MRMPLLRKREAQTQTGGFPRLLVAHARNGHHYVLPEDLFIRMLSWERQRTERSRKPFLLMLLQAPFFSDATAREKLFPGLASALASVIRETDVLGWHKENSLLGIIFTEVGSVPKQTLLEIIRSKITAALRPALGLAGAEQVRLSFHFFPEESEQEDRTHPTTSALFPDLEERNSGQKISHAIKRAIDIAGSSLALLVCSPVFLGIAAAIKLTSRGPVLFRQERVGKCGARFTFLKFRSMYVSNDPHIHKEFVQRFIAGQMKGEAGQKKGTAVYKIQDDPRVTPMGRFLRKTSLDEVPQLWNVFKGEMSLVGPRPPIPYEFESYDLWHRRRVLEVKPGITGLWQVSGRSRTKFDDMVRLDLRYAKTWSLWLDLKILLQTPRAILSGEGAY